MASVLLATSTMHRSPSLGGSEVLPAVAVSSGGTQGCSEQHPDPSTSCTALSLCPNPAPAHWCWCARLGVRVAITSAPEFPSVRPAKENYWMLQLLNDPGHPDSRASRGALLCQLVVEESPTMVRGLDGSMESLTWPVDWSGVIWRDCLCHLSEHMLQGMNY